MQPAAPRSAGDSPPPDSVRPNPALGAYYYIPYDHAGPRTSPDRANLAVFTHPPSVHFLTGAPPDFRRLHAFFRPDTVIGPVVGVDHTDRYTSVLIAGYWAIIWCCRVVRPYHGAPYRMGGPTIFPVTWQEVQRLCAMWGVPPPLVRWHHPFPELVRYAAQLGLTHFTVPDGATPPRFLLTGPSWFRLANAASQIRGVVRLVGALPRDIAVDIFRNLHARLDYPVAYGSTIHPHGFDWTIRGLDWAVAANGLDWTAYRDWDIRPRNAIRRLLRRWVRTRRAWRAAMRAEVLTRDEALPDAVLALPHVVYWIAAFLG